MAKRFPLLLKMLQPDAARRRCDRSADASAPNGTIGPLPQAPDMSFAAMDRRRINAILAVIPEKPDVGRVLSFERVSLWAKSLHRWIFPLNAR
jgi:hypothetical protein